MVDLETAYEFLAQKRIAVVGVSSRRQAFGNAICKALEEKGYDVVAVGTGVGCYSGLAEVPVPVDGVMVVVNADAAMDVVQDAAALGIPRVWLFQGIGKGAYTPAAAAFCKNHGMSVVEGACPLMFLEPVAWFHRAHRAVRRMKGALEAAA